MSVLAHRIATVDQFSSLIHFARTNGLTRTSRPRLHALSTMNITNTGLTLQCLGQTPQRCNTYPQRYTQHPNFSIYFIQKQTLTLTQKIGFFNELVLKVECSRMFPKGFESVVSWQACLLRRSAADVRTTSIAHGFASCAALCIKVH